VGRQVGGQSGRQAQGGKAAAVAAASRPKQLRRRGSGQLAAGVNQLAAPHSDRGRLASCGSGGSRSFVLLPPLLAAQPPLLVPGSAAAKVHHPRPPLPPLLVAAVAKAVQRNRQAAAAPAHPAAALRLVLIRRSVVSLRRLPLRHRQLALQGAVAGQRRRHRSRHVV
jgi:hypothetical protein